GELEELPAIIGFENALAAELPLHASIPGNICFDFEYGDAAKTHELIARAEHVVRVRAESPRVAPTPMEPRAALASFDAQTETYEIRCAHQGAFAMRDALAAMMDMPAEKISVNMVHVRGSSSRSSAAGTPSPHIASLA